MTKRIAEMTPEQRERARALARQRYHRKRNAERLSKMAQYRREKYQDPERRAAMQKASREWKRRNRKKHVAYNHAYYHSHKEHCRAQRRAYYRKNEAKMRAINRAHYDRRVRPLKQAKRNPLVKLFRNWTPNLEAA